jgi:ADP-heptose:LPS heptosyltransferase
LGGPEDREAGDEIAKTDPGKIYNACGKFSLLESADLVRRAKVIISNDTGLMHIAAAFQKPIISLWGNTTPDMGMFPYYGQNNLRMQPSPLSVMIEHKPLSCRPCSKLGFQKCPKKHFKCMNELPVGIMFDQVKAYWKNKP